MNKYTMYAVFAVLTGTAHAQQAPAQRYIDAQGVEIIQNRDAPRPPATGGQPRATGTRTAGTGGLVSPAAGIAAAAAAMSGSGAEVDPRLQISPAEQSARDRDRETILREELAQEMRKFEAATKAMVQTEQAARKQPEAGAVLKQLKETLHAHQQNIQSITAELQRTRVSR